jgi:hypothetical protein
MWVVIPAKAGIQSRLSQSHWIPAFAGMTRLYPIAATLRVLLSDSRVGLLSRSSRVNRIVSASCGDSRTLDPRKRVPLYVAYS